MFEKIKIFTYPIINGESPDEVTKKLHQDGYQVTGSGVNDSGLFLIYTLKDLDKVKN